MRFSLGTLLLVFCCCAWVMAGSTTPLKSPLDLPSGGKALVQDDERGLPIILFFDREFEGDAFFFCVPTLFGGACAPDEADEAEAILRAEFQGTLEQLTKSNYFSVVLYNADHHVWSERPRRATRSNKRSAIAWMKSIDRAIGQCVTRAVEETLAIARRSPVGHNQVIVLGITGPFCGTAHNAMASFDDGRAVEKIVKKSGGLRVNTHYVDLLGDGSSEAFTGFWRMLAEETGGEYKYLHVHDH